MPNRYEVAREITGSEPGKTSIILAGVHGNELPEVRALESLAGATIQRGRVLIYFGNPKAIEKGERLIDADLNRMFKSDDQLTSQQRNSYEYARAQELKEPLLKADTLLDLHGTRNPKGIPFIITEEKGFAVARTLPFGVVVSGFDDIQPGGTDYFMNREGRVGICAECGYNEDPSSERRATDTIQTFLIAQGHVDGTLPTPTPQRRIQAVELYVATNDFVFERNFADFEPIADGTVIGNDGTRKVTSPGGVIIFGHGGTIRAGKEVFIRGKELS